MNNYAYLVHFFLKKHKEPFLTKKIRNDYNSGIVLKRWRNDEEKRGRFRKAGRKATKFELGAIANSINDNGMVPSY